MDLVTSEECRIVKAIIRSLNAKARILEATQAQVELQAVMGTNTFDLESAQEHPLWAQELNHFKDHVPETQAYGISSFVYRSRMPFDPAKLHAFFDQEWPGVIRAKGFFWLATRPDLVGEFSQAGALVRHQGMGRWWAAVAESSWPEDAELREMIKDGWDADYGDRRQEMVFIGLQEEMDASAIRKQLDRCF